MASHLERIVYVNGEFLPGSEARISIFDRGFLFADAVYEGLGVRNGKIIDFSMHVARLKRSLGELNIPEPFDDVELKTVLEHLVSVNRITEGFAYLHVTRGEGERDYLYEPGLRPSVIAFVQSSGEKHENIEENGISMSSQRDLRWKRRDIKTSNLLGQVIAKNAASNAGTYEALLVDDNGNITEGGATSFFIVKDRAIIARPVTHEILHGITRQTMLKVAEHLSMEITEQIFTLQEAYSADEAFITGASSYIQPVVQIDGMNIGDGKPGPVTLQLRKSYLEFCDSF
ncbi:MAG: D-amino-acid transaminase [Pseudomonadota bacterium]